MIWFLSYKRSNKAVAKALADGLKKSGVAVWFDGELQPGDVWSEKVARGLESSAAFLVLVGADGIDGWVQIEVGYALNRQAQEGARFPIVPMIMPGVDIAVLPPLLKQHQALVLASTPKESDSRTFAEIAQKLRARLERDDGDSSSSGETTRRPPRGERPPVAARGPAGAVRRPLWRAVVAVVFLVALATILYWQRPGPGPDVPPYPRPDGLVANFVTGPGGPPRNVFGLHFSQFSDSVWNLASKVWHRRMDQEGTRGEGFLRIYYQLVSESDREPFVGVFTDFSVPATARDLSAFRRLAVRMRIGQQHDPPIKVALFVYSTNVANWENGTPTYLIEPQDLRQEWTSITVMFDRFGPSNTSTDGETARLDPARIVRVGIHITGTPMNTAHGHIDVDEIKFER
jgi:hypothetical protein